MPSGMPRCWVRIDLAALERNLGRIRTALPSPLRYIAVVKADAYGHGIDPVCTRLMRAGTDLFAVASVEEAESVRELGEGWPILVLGPTVPGEEEMLVELSAIPAISSPDEVTRIGAAADRHNRKLPVHLKVDTGMGRAGVWHEKADRLFQQIRSHPSLHIAGIFTHLSSADSDPAFTEEQRRIFLKRLRSWQVDPDEIMVHIDNSAGIETFQSGHGFNAVRIGLLQFGVLPHEGSLLSAVHVDPVLSFHSQVGLVKELPKGTGISYGRTARLPERSRVAVVTSGYGDGVPFALSNCGEILIRGKRRPILGRVTMDQTVVLLGDDESVVPGDVATWIGRQGDEFIAAEEFAARSRTIPWDVFCSITKRVARIYATDTAT